MRKFKIFIDINKEEVYLNEMAKKGYIFKKYTQFGVYHFIKSDPQNLNYRIDYRGFSKKTDFEDYKSLFDDSGWKHVYGTKSSYNQYFLPKEGTEDNDIFSTEESKAARYKRLINVCIYSSCIFIIYLIAIFSINNFDISNFGFLTPGIWQKSGWNFLTAFLFELPFVLLRIVPILFLLFMSILYGIWAYKAKKIYELGIEKK